MKNKLWLGISLVVFVALVLAACSAPATSAPTSIPATEAPAATQPPVAAEKVQVTMLGTLKPEIATQVEAAIAAYNSSQDKYHPAVLSC